MRIAAMAIAALAATPARAALAEYEVINVTSLIDGKNYVSTPTDVTADGRMTGWVQVAQGTLPFLYSGGKTILLRPPIPGLEPARHQCAGRSFDGAGGVLVSCTVLGRKVHYIYKAGSWTELTSIGGVKPYKVLAISGSQALVEGTLSEGATIETYLVTAGAKPRKLNFPPGYGIGFVGVASDGTAVGLTMNARTGRTQSFLEKDGKVTVLAPVGNESLSAQATAISAAGKVAGFATSGASYGFLYNGDYTFLLHPPEGQASIARGVDDMGNVVGDRPTADGRDEPFLYDKGKAAMINLAGVSDRPAGLPPLSRAFAVAGKYIAAQAVEVRPVPGSKPYKLGYAVLLRKR